MFAWDSEKMMHVICWTAYELARFIKLCWRNVFCDVSTTFVIDSMHVLVLPLLLCPLVKCTTFIQLWNGDIVSCTPKEGLNMSKFDGRFLSCFPWMHTILVYDYMES
jgi:hypothetical protein